MIINKDCLEALKELPDNSIDSIVTDPPYGLSFMGKKWDYDVPSTEIWSECLRVLKPGGYLLAFAGTRTQHRMAVRIEDAGFEIRDMIAWVYGSGFPKSLNIGKAVDKLQGNKREISGYEERFGREGRKANCGFKEEYVGASGTQDQSAMKPIMLPVSEEAKQWEGWGTALKPALEPITVARKPIEGNVAQNCLKWGVGGINIDGSRVETDDKVDARKGHSGFPVSVAEESRPLITHNLGRFPANLIHDGSEEVRECFPETKTGKAIRSNSGGKTFGGENEKPVMEDLGYEDGGGNASRFFKSIIYQAKASKSERNMGLEGFEEIELRGGGGRANEGYDEEDPEQQRLKDAAQAFGAVKAKKANFHPTVKPIKLMEYLVNLVSKEGHTVLDPFAGSGTTGIACKRLNRDFIGIERDQEYCKIAEARINNLTL